MSRPDLYTGPELVISGGQTGADQGGLLAAWQRGIKTGGWAPRDYRTNVGPNPLLEVLGLVPTETFSYEYRTERNVVEADATLLFGYDLTSAGSRLTGALAEKLGKPLFRYEFPVAASSREVYLTEGCISFLLQHRPRIINVAGNRDTEATTPNLTATRQTFGLILDLLKTWQ